MVIRDSQYQAMTQAVQAHAEKELFEHCRQYAPRLFQAAGEDGVHQAVVLGLSRARAYGFSDEPQIRLYLDTMLVLGSHFDTDPQFPWAAETLQDKFSKPHVRALVLHRDLCLYIDRVMGPRREYVREALDRVSKLPEELPRLERRNAEHLREWLVLLYPQKSDDLTDEQVARTAATATYVARQFGVAGGDGIIGSVLLVFGHGATYDPLYPWISGVLRDPLITSPEGRLQRLYDRLRVDAWQARKYLA